MNVIKKWIQTKLSLVKESPKNKLLLQFIKFGMVGASNTMISLIITYGMMLVFHFCFQIDTTWSLNVSTLVGFMVGVCNSYYWNNKYVFQNKQESNPQKAFVKVTLCYAVTYLLSTVLMDLLVVCFHIPRFLAPIPRLVFTIPLNFILNKLWAFRDR